MAAQRIRRAWEPAHAHLIRVESLASRPGPFNILNPFQPLVCSPESLANDGEDGGLSNVALGGGWAPPG